MLVTIRGWKRDHGPTNLFKEPIEDITVSDDVPTTYIRDTAYAVQETDPIRGLKHVVYSKNVKITANGDYQIAIKLTKSDILHLAWMVMGPMPLKKFVSKFKSN